MSESAHQSSLTALLCRDINEKQHLTNFTQSQFNQHKLSLFDDIPVESIPVPGRPAKPLQVSPHDVPKRKLTTDEGRGAFIHALAHIEFNAINLALDAVYRFRELPEAYYQEWLSVAVEEARHFQMLQQRLNDYGYQYGDFPAHNGLWDMAVRTENNLLERMALVPKVFEARGLDVTPGMISKLLQVGDKETAEILKVIYTDEIGHVAIGNRWFNYACDQKGLNPQDEFIQLVTQHFPGPVRGKLNFEARLQAGFTQQELDQLKALK